jgi:hypothetical protein
MKRRAFLGNAVGSAASPFAARGPQSPGYRRTAMDCPTASVPDVSENGDHSLYSMFFRELRRVGYVEMPIRQWLDAPQNAARRDSLRLRLTLSWTS